jgi:hypothetical protein
MKKVFVPTLIKITKNQQKTECPSFSLPCLKDSDCKANELPIYMEKGLCQNLTALRKVLFSFYLQIWKETKLKNRGMYSKPMVSRRR